MTDDEILEAEGWAKFALVLGIFAVACGLVCAATAIAALIPGHVPGVGWGALGTGIAAAVFGFGAYRVQCGHDSMHRTEHVVSADVMWHADVDPIQPVGDGLLLILGLDRADAEAMARQVISRESKERS